MGTPIGVPFEFEVQLPEGFNENNLPVEVPFNFYNDEYLQIVPVDATGDIPMKWASAKVRIGNSDANRAIEVVPYGDHTALILVYSTKQGEFTFTDKDGDEKVFDDGTAVLKDVTNAGYVYRYNKADEVDYAPQMTAKAFYEKVGSDPVYVYGVVVDTDRLDTATGIELLGGSATAQVDDEAWVLERLTFDPSKTQAAEDILDYSVGINVDGDARTDAADETIVKAIAHGSRSSDGTASGTIKASNRFFNLTLKSNNASALRSDINRPADEVNPENNANGADDPRPYAKSVSEIEENLFLNVWKMN